MNRFLWDATVIIWNILTFLVADSIHAEQLPDLQDEAYNKKQDNKDH